MLRWVVKELLRLPAGMTIRADDRDSGHQVVLEYPNKSIRTQSQLQFDRGLR